MQISFFLMTAYYELHPSVTERADEREEASVDIPDGSFDVFTHLQTRSLSQGADENLEDCGEAVTFDLSSNALLKVHT